MHSPTHTCTHSVEESSGEEASSSEDEQALPSSTHTATPSQSETASEAVSEVTHEPEKVQYASREDAKQAFKELLREKGVATNMNWDQAMKLIVTDSRWVSESLYV